MPGGKGSAAKAAEQMAKSARVMATFNVFGDFHPPDLTQRHRGAEAQRGSIVVVNVMTAELGNMGDCNPSGYGSEIGERSALSGSIAVCDSRVVV